MDPDKANIDKLINICHCIVRTFLLKGKQYLRILYSWTQICCTDVMGLLWMVTDCLKGGGLYWLQNDGKMVKKYSAKDDMRMQYLFFS